MAKKDYISLPEEGASTTEASSRVLYIGHLPHGFFEKQILGYFSQFGKVTRVRVSRCKKTAKPKHYAFVEFQNADVAKIVADSMNGYFLFTQKLVVKVIPHNKVHPRLFDGANRKFRAIPWAKIERLRHDKKRDPAEQARRLARLFKRDKQRKEKISRFGLDYEYPDLKSALPVKPTKIIFFEDGEA